MYLTWTILFFLIKQSININYTNEFRKYLSEIKKQVLKAQDEDVGMGQITQKVKMPYFQKFKLYKDLHNRNVLDAYKELEMMEDEDEDEE